MAGGPTTVAPAPAVSSAAKFAFLAGGYKTPAALAAETEQFRASVAEFGVNLFVASTETIDEHAVATDAREIESEADAHGLELDPSVVVDDDRWGEKLALLLELPVSVVSLTFGLPAA
ncbi:nitronate monooxygenase, partial [Brevibacterium sediminis]